VDESAVLQEQVIQESITGFHQRLARAYPEFGDLNSLLSIATLQLRLGLRLALKANRINSEAVTTITALTSYPSVGSPLVASLRHEHLILGASTSIYLCLVKLELEVSIGIQLRHLLPQFETLCDQVLRLWLIDKAREAENEATSQSLYREADTQYGAKTDAELEEQEFLALFPSYEDSLAKRTTGIHNADPTRNVSTEYMVLMTSLYLNIFSSAALKKPTLERLDQTRKRLLSESLSSLAHELPGSLDAAALAYRLRFAHDARLFLETPVDNLTAYNFYKDPNPHEIKSASYMVIALRAQLKRLFDEWPDQMVLQHLMDRCDVILGFSLESPIAKVLSSLEQLLLHTDDWEMYANRSNSLTTYRQSLTELIVRWRRLELGGRNGMLESEARAFAEGASEWWFRLYNALIRGLSDAMRSGEDGKYLSTIIPLIDDFVSTSPLGQIFFRIRLLQSFERFIYELSATKENAEKHCLSRIVCIIRSFLQYYGMFQPSLQLYLTEQRIALDKEIKNLIKLASWKDINVQALKQSALKTHHQLYKIIRKFREVLREPVTHRLRTGTSVITEADLRHLPSIHQQPENLHLAIPHALSVSLAGPLSDLGTTLKKFERLIHTKITPFVSRRHNTYADDLAIAIITTSKELSDVSIPKNVPAKKRTKFLKSLLVRKRKAFSDLLKELKAVGLSSNVTAEISRQNADPLWLRGQPVFGNAVIDFGLIKAETYFSKLIASLPELRTSLSDHHNDLQTRELQRGQSFLESGFSIAVDLRAR
jgi:midasin